MMSRRFRPVLLLSAALALACSADGPDAGDAPPPSEPGPPSPSSPMPTTLEDARVEIDRLIGQARAADVSQCSLVPLGVRPCGGPREYLAYSRVATDSPALATLVQLYDRLDRERNEREGLVSTCELMMPPELALEGGTCVTRPPGAIN